MTYQISVIPTNTVKPLHNEFPIKHMCITKSSGFSWNIIHVCGPELLPKELKLPYNKV